MTLDPPADEQRALNRLWNRYRSGAPLPTNVTARIDGNGNAVIAIHPDAWTRKADALIWRKMPSLQGLAGPKLHIWAFTGTF